MKRIITIALALFVAVPAFCADDIATLRSEIQIMKAQLKQLEAKLDNQSKTTQRLQANAQAVQAKAVQMQEDNLSLMESFAQLKEVNDRISLSGNLDIVGVYADENRNNATVGPFSKEDYSDIYIDQLRLNLDIAVAEKVRAFVGLQFEDYRLGTYAGNAAAAADTDVDGSIQLDEAYVEFGGEEGYYSIVGKQYMPFGNVTNYGHFINDSLARQLFEIKDTGLVVGYREAGMDAAVFGLNSVASGGGHNDVDVWGASVSFAKDEGEEGMSLKVGAGVVNNIYAATNSTGGLINYATGAWSVPINGPVTYNDTMPAYDLYAVYGIDAASFSAEYVSTWDEADPGDIGSDTDNVRPSALSLEAAITVPMNDRDVTLAAKYEKNRFQDEYGNPLQSVWGLGASTDIAENTSLNLNYEYQKYDADISGNGHTNWLGAELRVKF